LHEAYRLTRAVNGNVRAWATGKDGRRLNGAPGVINHAPTETRWERLDLSSGAAPGKRVRLDRQIVCVERWTEENCCDTASDVHHLAHFSG
jgi:hypothetical protein